MNNNIFFSIAIPFYFKNVYSFKQLNRCIESIRIQSFKNYEIIISAQNYYKELINNSNFKDIKILNASSESFIQGNVNNAIKSCKGKWIKIIFSDDYFLDNYSLEKIYNALIRKEMNWAFTNSLHFNKKRSSIYKPIFAFYNKNILEINTIGSPSALIIKNINPIYFDKKTWMRLDVDYYHSLFKKFGDPIYIKDVFIVNEIHKNQFSNLMKNKTQKTKILLKKEIEYLCKKHNYKKLNFISLFFYKLFIGIKRLLDEIYFK